MKQCFCNDCKIEGVIICTATKSLISTRGGIPHCNKGELSIEEARERKDKLVR